MPSFEKQNQENQESNLSNLSIAYKKAMPYINLVYVLLASIVMFGVIGWFGDKYLHSKPIFFVLGLFLGFGIGFYSFFKSLKQLENHKN